MNFPRYFVFGYIFFLGRIWNLGLFLNWKICRQCGPPASGSIARRHALIGRPRWHCPAAILPPYKNPWSTALSSVLELHYRSSLAASQCRLGCEPSYPHGPHASPGCHVGGPPVHCKRTAPGVAQAIRMALCCWAAAGFSPMAFGLFFYFSNIFKSLQSSKFCSELV
jgi:hypothetical protein